MSLFADYIREKNGDEIIETEHGFATYRYVNEQTVYIVDLYIVPEYRKSNKAGALADKIVEAARRKGCTRLMGTVHPAAKTASASLRVLLGYGMRLVSSGPEFIIFEKDINNG
jgi:GNAT superfamily N-acetyltransferase